MKVFEISKRLILPVMVGMLTIYFQKYTVPALAEVCNLRSGQSIVFYDLFFLVWPIIFFYFAAIFFVFGVVSSCKPDLKGFREGGLFDYWIRSLIDSVIVTALCVVISGFTLMTLFQEDLFDDFVAITIMASIVTFSSFSFAGLSKGLICEFRN